MSRGLVCAANRLGAYASGGGFDETARRGVTCEDPAPVRSRPRWSRRIPTRIAHGIGHDHAWVFMDSIGNKAVNPKLAESAPDTTLQFHGRTPASRPTALGGGFSDRPARSRQDGTQVATACTLRPTDPPAKLDRGARHPRTTPRLGLGATGLVSLAEAREQVLANQRLVPVRWRPALGEGAARRGVPTFAETSERVLEQKGWRLARPAVRGKLDPQPEVIDTAKCAGDPRIHWSFTASRRHRRTR